MLKLKPKFRPSFSIHENSWLLSLPPVLNYASFASQLQVNQEKASDSNSEKEMPSRSISSLSSDPKFQVSCLQNCKSLSQVKMVHALTVTTGMLQNLFVTNKLLYIYCQFKAIDHAFAVFRGIDEKNPFSWSVMVGGFVKIGDFKSCFKTFRDFIESGLPPDNYTLPIVLRACRDRRDIETGRTVHHVVLKFGLSSDQFISACLVDMYAKCREIEEARKVFDKMPVRDLVTWTVMISAYGDSGDANESLALFDRMREEGVVPDKVTMVTVVNACARLGAMNKARHVQSYLNHKGFPMDVILGTALIDMYAKCGSIETAKEVFEKMKHKNVVTWSAMVAAYGYHGLSQEALDLFSSMINGGIRPNNVTFLSVLYACSHSGLVNEGLRLFSLMQNDYYIRPDVKHYTCMVDLLGRAGKLNEAVKLIDDMEVEKDEGLWSALLGACRLKGDLSLAETATKNLLELQPQNAGHYVLLSNIYAKAQRWNDVARVRGSLTSRRLKKVPGWTWIEVGDEVHRFSVGCGTHPRSREINEMLESVRRKLDKAGYVPDTDFVLHDVDEEVKEQMLFQHSEKLAIAFGLIATPDGSPIRITKNLRICGDCHTFSKMVSEVTKRTIVARDASRFHRFSQGVCSCGDYW